MANTVKMYFWVRKSQLNKLGEGPLMMRLSFQGKRVDRSSGYYISPSSWDSIKQFVKGAKQNAQEINSWISIQKGKLSMKLNQIASTKESIFLPEILDTLFFTYKEEPSLLNIIKAHNKNLKERLNIDYRYSTYEKYVFTYDKVKAFIEVVYKKSDVFLKDLTVKFIMDFDHYLRVKDKNQHNTAVKYCLNLKRIINVAVLQNLLPKNPFTGYKTVYKNIPQTYLDEKEVNKLEQIPLVLPAHILVRDLFIFQCYTGLAYTDLISLLKDEIYTDHLGKEWILKRRQKTGIPCTIPLLPKAKAILIKYDKDPSSRKAVFNSYSIQKYNQYIGEVGQLAKLNNKLSSHVGRRTFGNIALRKGISLNVISKILGHANTIITQKVYAITTQQLIASEISKWK